MSFNNSNGRRHRRDRPAGVGTIITAAVVAYGAYRAVNWAWNVWNESIVDNDNDNQAEEAKLRTEGQDGTTVPSCIIHHQQQRQQQLRQSSSRRRLRQQRIHRCRDEAANAYSDFLPALKRVIEELTNSSEQTSRLKQLRKSTTFAEEEDPLGETQRRVEEKALWEIVKVNAVTRMVATAYAHTILFLVLNVQVHLLGGRLLEALIDLDAPLADDSLADNSLASTQMNSYQASHRLVLQHTYDFFFQTGLQLLVESVERSVQSVLESWDVTSPSSLQTSEHDFDQALQDIRTQMEGAARGRHRRSRSRTLLRFLLPPEHESLRVPDTLAQSILDETWDLLESPVLEDAQRDSLQLVFDRMRESGWGNLFREDGQGPTRPLAHIITKLKATSNSFYKKSSSGTLPRVLGEPKEERANPYIEELERLPTVLELGGVSFN